MSELTCFENRRSATSTPKPINDTLFSVNWIAFSQGLSSPHDLFASTVSSDLASDVLLADPALSPNQSIFVCQPAEPRLSPTYRFRQKISEDPSSPSYDPNSPRLPPALTKPLNLDLDIRPRHEHGTDSVRSLDSKWT